jgi:hypothetical protein
VVVIDRDESYIIKERRCSRMARKISAIVITILSFLIAGGAHLKWL